MMKRIIKRWTAALLCGVLLFTNTGTEQLVYAAEAEEITEPETEFSEDTETPENEDPEVSEIREDSAPEKKASRLVTAEA